jgi:phytoene dehydrogenase-like protein
VRARRVAANVNPRTLYLQMLAAGDVDPAVRERMRRYRAGSASFRMNVALSELPRFDDSGPQGSDIHRSGILISPTLAYMDRAHADARLAGMSREPVVEMLIPSTLDDSLAPAGQHVASLFCQHFAPTLPDGRSWQDERQRAADLIIDTVTRHAPNFRRSILGVMALSPFDLEQRFGLPSGDIFHGALGLDQLWAARPLLGHGDYRTGIKGLYLCGSGGWRDRVAWTQLRACDAPRQTRMSLDSKPIWRTRVSCLLQPTESEKRLPKSPRYGQVAASAINGINGMPAKSGNFGQPVAGIAPQPCKGIEK